MTMRCSGRQNYVLGRLWKAAVTILFLALMNFLIIHAAPGDAADVIAGENAAGDAAYIADLRAKLGLDRSMAVQIGLYLKSLLSGDLRLSARQNIPVFDLVTARLPATLLLILCSIGLALLGGVAFGLVAAFNRGRWVDRCVSFLALIGYATPLFWLGLMLVILFTVQWRLLPSSGMRTAGLDEGGLVAALDLARHLVLPTATLAFFYMATYARIVRASAYEILKSDFITTAVAKGVPRGRIARIHVLRNVMLPVLTLLGLQFASALGGAIVVEVVFGWPGMGRLAYEAIMQRDVNLLLGILLFSSVLVVFVNLAVDLLYGILDPRVTLA